MAAKPITIRDVLEIFPGAVILEIKAIRPRAVEAGSHELCEGRGDLVNKKAEKYDSTGSILERRSDPNRGDIWN